VGFEQVFDVALLLLAQTEVLQKWWQVFCVPMGMRGHGRFAEFAMGRKIARCAGVGENQGRK
jgi:hypothetical protein